MKNSRVLKAIKSLLINRMVFPLNVSAIFMENGNDCSKNGKIVQPERYKINFTITKNLTKNF